MWPVDRTKARRANIAWAVLILTPILAKLTGASEISWFVALIPPFVFAGLIVAFFGWFLCLLKPWNRGEV